MRKAFLLPLAILLGAGFLILPESARFWLDVLICVPCVLFALYIFFKYMVPYKEMVNDVREELRNFRLDVYYFVMYPFIGRDHDSAAKLGRIPMRNRKD